MSQIDLASDQAIENGVRLTRGARRLLRDLVAIRTTRGLSKAEVAEAIGIDRSGITRFESQEKQPRLDTILRYAHAVGASVTFLVETTEEWDERNAVRPGSQGKRRVMWSQTDEEEGDSSVRDGTLWTERVVRSKTVLR